MSYARPEALVETAWLAERLGDRALRIVDGSWYLPAEQRDPKAEFAAGHIPGAVYFDIDAIADRASLLPHMFPDAGRFAAAVGALGIGNDHRIVCYDGGSTTAAGRVWWMFRAFGHERVAILNGGARKWRAEGRPWTADAPAVAARTYDAAWRPELVADIGNVRRLAGGEVAGQILDARSAGRFSGAEPEPRAGMRSGHMPGAKNLPYGRLLREDGTLADAVALRAALAEAGIDDATPVTASCGSGVSATVPLLALHLLGRDDIALYDGSWSEWGGREDTPVETG